ncbi:hypothetical protein [Paenibacillus tritici]|nr:hypothetical protein [Paenibacillus tritici]
MTRSLQSLVTCEALQRWVSAAFGYNGPEAKNSLEQIKHWFRR